ncbi:hypothetical protein Sjap_001054 [Stephania japonica]|uniref:Uncharacterized protein n=1 Tax=Stephania japonica TaxID=461633 RepID=A0AAP0KL03_9MAGN
MDYYYTWLRAVVLLACLMCPALVECRVRHYKFNVSMVLGSLELDGQTVQHISHSALSSQGRAMSTISLSLAKEAHYGIMHIFYGLEQQFMEPL